MNVFDLEAVISLNTSEYESRLSAAGSQMEAVGSKISQIGNSISQFGSSIMKKVTLPLVAIGTLSAKKFAEVDKTMQLTNSTMGNTAEQAEMLSGAMKEAASNSTFGMNDAATATLNFARAGLKAEQAAAALAPAMNLAAGEGGDLDTVSAGLVATINGFHGSFDQAAQYADVFANACNNSALDINSLSSAMSVAAPIFSAAGYSVNDAALYMGVMANNGIEASVAANSLKSGFARLVKPTDEAAETMEQLGISVTNADGTMKDTVSIQSELHDSFSKLSEAEQIAAASAIFGKHQMAPWLALINSAPADVNKLNKSLQKTGTTTKMADAMMSGFGGAMEKLKSSIDVAATSFGEALAPMIRRVSDRIQGLVNWFNSLSAKQKESAAKWALTAAAIGPVIMIAGKLISSIGTLTKTFGLLFQAMEANPIIALTAAAAGLGVALYASHEAGQKALEAQYGLNEEQQKSIDTINGVTDAYNEATKARNEATASIQADAQYSHDLVDEYNSLIDANGQVKAGYEARAEFIKGQLAESLGVEKGKIEELIGANGQLDSSIHQLIDTKKAEAILDANKDMYTEAIKNRKNAVEQLGPALQTLAQQEQVVNSASEKVAEAQRKYDNAVADGDPHRRMFKNQLVNAQAALDAASESYDKAKANVDSYTETLQKSGEQIQSYEGLSTALIEGDINAVNQWTTTLTEGIKTRTNATQAELQQQAQIITEQYNAIKAAYDAGQAGITSEMVDEAYKRMTTAQTEAGSVGASSQKEASSVKTNLSSAQTSASGSFSKIQSDAQTYMQGATTAVEAQANAIKNKFPISLGQLFTGTMNTIVANIKQNATQASVSYTTGVQRFAKAMNQPYMFTRPAFFDYDKVAGEAGDEILYGRNSLMKDIRTALSEGLMNTLYGGGLGGVTMNIYASDGMDVNELAEKVEQRLVQLERQRANAWA